MSKSRRRQSLPDPRQMSFLPPVEINATWPNEGTQAHTVLQRLLAGERLTQPSFGFTCWRLAACIKTLRYLGWAIAGIDVPRPAIYGTGKPIREYWLPHWVPAALVAKEPSA
jgi:hypothetical protein